MARSLAVFKAAASFLRRHRTFSSSSAAVSHRREFYYDNSEGEESFVYQHKLKFQRPSTIKNHQAIENSVSLIGEIDRPFKQVRTGNGSFGLHTLLNVSDSSQSCPSFKIMLKVWGETAKVAMEHLKPKDLVYVWGHLRSYTKAENGLPKINYEVVAKEINFVSPDDQSLASSEFEKKESGFTGEDASEKYRNRLHLWQILFANPREWMDFRRNKVNPNHPDFKHRDTREALWLKPDDPPWIKRQLEILDSRFG